MSVNEKALYYGKLRNNTYKKFFYSFSRVSVFKENSNHSSRTSLFNQVISHETVPSKRSRRQLQTSNYFANLIFKMVRFCFSYDRFFLITYIFSRKAQVGNVSMRQTRIFPPCFMQRRQRTPSRGRLSNTVPLHMENNVFTIKYK